MKNCFLTEITMCLSQFCKAHCFSVAHRQKMHFMKRWILVFVHLSFELPFIWCCLTAKTVLLFFSTDGGSTGKQTKISVNYSSTVSSTKKKQLSNPTSSSLRVWWENSEGPKQQVLFCILIPAVEMVLYTVKAYFGVYMSFIVPQGEAHSVAASRWACQVILAAQWGATFCGVTMA